MVYAFRKRGETPSKRINYGEAKFLTESDIIVVQTSTNSTK
jgi:hypothetical protein